MALRSGSLNRKGIFETCSLLGWPLLGSGMAPAAAAAATARVATAVVGGAPGVDTAAPGERTPPGTVRPEATAAGLTCSGFTEDWTVT